jgi:hypothetical protein
MWPFTCGAIGCPGRRHCRGCPSVGQRLDKAIERADWELRAAWRVIVRDRWVLLALLVSAFLGTGVFNCSGTIW